MPLPNLKTFDWSDEMFPLSYWIKSLHNRIPLTDDVGSLAWWEALRKSSMRSNEINDWLNTSLKMKKIVSCEMWVVFIDNFLCINDLHTLYRPGLQPFWGSQTRAPSSQSAPGCWRPLQTPESWTSCHRDSQTSHWLLFSLLQRI